MQNVFCTSPRLFTAVEPIPVSQGEQNQAKDIVTILRIQTVPEAHPIAQGLLGDPHKPGFDLEATQRKSRS